MKIRFKREALLEATNIVLRAVPSNTTMTILQCILIKAENNEVTFITTDNELGIKTVIGSAKCEINENGITAVEAKLFSDIVRKITTQEESDILFTSDGSIIEISCNNSYFRIQERDPDQFPSLPVLDKEKNIIMTQFTLKEIIRSTIFSIAANDSNKMMTGELFEVNGTMLKVVSLDGHRISIRNTELKEDHGQFSAIIPGKTLNELSKIINGETDKYVEILFSSTHAMFKFDDTVIISRLIDGEYFKINSMLSSDYDTKIIVNKKEFIENIEQSIILIRENDKRPLVIDIRDSNMNLKMNSIAGSMDSTVIIDKQGRDLMIAFNPKFLNDVLRVIDDEEVVLYMTNPKAPCFIKDEEGKYIYLILPVNFNPATY